MKPSELGIGRENCNMYRMFRGIRYCDYYDAAFMKCSSVKHCPDGLDDEDYFEDEEFEEKKMKTIQLSDEDYKTLMELSKEYQTQDTYYQAFPRFWVPSSEKLVHNIHDEGQFIKIYYDGETYTPEEFSNSFTEHYTSFLKDFWRNNPSVFYDSELEKSWIDYIDYKIYDAKIYTLDYKRQADRNPSLFLSDVELFCKANQHHLGQDPKPFGDTIFRMPKMEKLIKILSRLNRDVPEDEIDSEIKHYALEEK